MAYLMRSKNYILAFSIFFSVLLTTFNSYGSLDFPKDKDIFEKIQTEISSQKEIDPDFAKIYVAELKNLQALQNIKVDPSIDYVFVLSGRSSYLKEPIDLKNGVKDPADDYNRLELGISVARNVVARRLHKSTITDDDIEKYGPQIIYNGTPKHNETLKKILAEGKLINYPCSKFHILELEPTELNTRGQFKSLKKDLPLSYTSVAIVTHAYHFPRVARMINSKWHPFGPLTKVFFYLVDRELKAPGVKEDMIGEMKRIPTYVRNGDLKANISEQVILLPLKMNNLPKGI